VAADDLLRTILLDVVLPLWVLAGLADWACHRATRIELRSGVAESNFHLGLYGLVGAAGLAAFALEITTAVLLLLIAVWLAHELLTWVELRYVVTRREVRPFEQMVHGFLELLPFSAIVILAALNPEAAGGLVDWSVADWALRSRESWESFAEIAPLAAATVLLNLVPLLEENVRCRRRTLPLRGPRLLYP
jgi:hypothetical protein